MSDSSSVMLATFFTAVILLAVGILLVVTGRRGGEGRLRRNHYVGVRTMTTLSSDEAWYAAHRACAVQFAVAGYGLVVGGVALAIAAVLVHDLNQLGTWMTVISLVAAAWTIIWAVAGAIVGQRAAKEVVEREERGGNRGPRRHS